MLIIILLFGTRCLCIFGISNFVLLLLKLIIVSLSIITVLYHFGLIRVRVRPAKDRCWADPNETDRSNGGFVACLSDTISDTLQSMNMNMLNNNSNCCTFRFA